jgi:hypothetical protein
MAKIYALKNTTSDDVYIGSTVKELKRRLQNHKADYNRYLKGKFRFVTAFDILKCETAYIELLEEFDISNRYVRERYWIENTVCVNKFIPNRTRKEIEKAHYESHKEECRKRALDRYYAKKSKLQTSSENITV